MPHRTSSICTEGHRAVAVAVLVGVGLLSASVHAQRAEQLLRELPPGALSVALTDGVAAEVCRDHLFDPAPLALTLPAGYRLHRAEELAARNPALAAWLREQPAAQGHAVGILCFLSVDRFAVDGSAAPNTAPLPMAFWWASAEGPRADAMRGAVDYLQLGSWYAPASGPLAVIRRNDPMAEHAEITVERVAPERWRLRLVLPGETVTAEVQADAQSTPRKSTQPGTMTVPLSGASAGYFNVFAYLGHRSRKAEGQWQAQGQGVFSRAFAQPGEAAVFATRFQEAWTAQSGLYRFTPK